jgi:predicted nucleotidyltransferase
MHTGQVIPSGGGTIRQRFLQEALWFVREAGKLPGVRRIALLGSIVTDKRDPKDIDLLVYIEDDMDLASLAALGRRLKGHLQSSNRTADLFLADLHSSYLGRICSWKNCGPGIRATCDALHCGRRLYLHDDLATVRLARELVAAPPIELWPQVVRRCPAPDDVEELLRALEVPLGNDVDN